MGCAVEVRGACKCLPKEVKTNSGTMIGNCLSEDHTSSAGDHKGRKWCYVKKGDDESCCENTTQRFAKLCVSYSACGGDTGGSDDDDNDDNDDDYEYPEDDYEDYEFEGGRCKRGTGRNKRTPCKRFGRAVPDR